MTIFPLVGIATAVGLVAATGLVAAVGLVAANVVEVSGTVLEEAADRCCGGGCDDCC